MLEQIKQHWLTSIITICATVVTATWGVSNEIRVKPLENEIRRIRDLKDDAPTKEPSAPKIKNGTPMDISGEIHSPIDNQLVPFDGTNVIAETDEFPNTMERWLLLYASGEKRWYPVRVANNRDRKFNQKIDKIGRPNDDLNSKYEILLFIIDNDTGAVLRKYEAEGKGIDFLPYGKEIGKVAVRR